MIRSFRDREAEKLFHRERSRRLPEEIQRATQRKLEILDAAESLDDLKSPPGNRLERRTMSRSSTPIKKSMRARKKLPPVHPGEILLEEFMKPLGLSQYRVAKDIGVPPRRVNEIVHGKRAVTADTSLRLSRYFGTSERFWLNLQARYDLELEKDKLGDRLEKEVRQLARVG